MEDKTDLARLVFRVHAVSAELEELDRLLNEVVAPGIRHASASVRALQAELRELAGMERIDVEVAVRAVDEFGGTMAGGVGPDGIDSEQSTRDD